MWNNAKIKKLTILIAVFVVCVILTVIFWIL